MRVPFNEILQFNTWASTQITALADCPDEMTRLESVLYGIPVTARLTRADYISAVENARFNPNVPASVYGAFKANRPQW